MGATENSGFNSEVQRNLGLDFVTKQHKNFKQFTQLSVSDMKVFDLIQNSISFHVVWASLVDNNTIITRFSIQTAGLAFGGTGLCSYRVRGVGGSCAEHLTVESYTIIISLQSYLLSYLLLLVFHHPLTLSLYA